MVEGNGQPADVTNLPMVQIAWDNEHKAVRVGVSDPHAFPNIDFTLAVIDMAKSALQKLKADQEAMMRLQAIQQQAADQQLAHNLQRGGIIPGH